MRQEYWIITSKRKPRLWKPTSKHDFYDTIFFTKDDAESTLTKGCLKYYKAVKVAMVMKPE